MLIFIVVFLTTFLSLYRRDETALTPQQLQSIVEYLPSAEESSALKQYAEVNGNDIIADLCECEKFMFAMLDIRQAKNKIRCLLFKQQFPSSFEQLQKGLSSVLVYVFRHGSKDILFFLTFNFTLPCLSRCCNCRTSM
jgi:hypothetical protein